ncbi:DUF2339 domain-containing protein [Acidisphaera sp. S103]|uniref:DUF2339 domain-containing protein n=1 Tax=Acidisphaera sp. S103 TaxID=1747223 RepID=UPI00131D8E58|nr:DUF2339 domain-containing protein [Acidisphaera sp. S103]
MDVLLQVGWFGGWVLGIIGFFLAHSAWSELRHLRGQLIRQNFSQPQPAAAELASSEQAIAVPDSVPVVQVEPPPLPAPEPVAGIPEPVVASVASPPPPPRDLEALLTTRLGVWVGSAALLLAGVFLVRYAVEQALLGPAARCVAAALLGLILLAAAEWLHRHEGPPLVGPFRVDQAPSALAAGGTAFLFGAAYGAGPLYGLLPPLIAFGAMAAASLTALAAALRYGPLTAATGIAGAFITPALVASQAPSLPGLFAYLFVVSAAALLVVRHTAWTWLGWATTAAGAIWVCVAAIPDAPDRWAAAAFVAAAAALNLALLPAAALDHPVGRRLAWVPFAVMGVAGLVLESWAPGMAPRLALFLLSPIAVWKGVIEPRLDRLPWIAALFGLLTLLCWALPAWTPTGEIITVEGVVEAILPGAWAPEVIRPLITAAALLAAFHAGAGLWLERRAPAPVRWAALPAAVPVLTLAVAYAQIARFQGDPAWAAIALTLTAGLTATAAAAVRDDDRQRAGVHAAGAVAALALGCAMLLHDYWLTLAVALFLPALAWIEARAELPALRTVALVVAGLVIVRLVLNWYVLDYVFGTMPLANGLVVAYAAPSAAFALASVLFRRRGDDLPVAVLEAGAVIFMALFVALEIRHYSGDGQLADPFSFTEVALHLLTIAIQATAYLYLAQRTSRPVLFAAWQILGGIGLIYAAVLLVANPMFTGAAAGVFALVAAYLAPALLAVLACRLLPDGQPRRGLGAYAVVAGFAWVTLQIRQCFHPDGMELLTVPVEDAELWAWSGGWLAYGIGLMVMGIRSGQRLLRLAALGVIGLVCAKVFLVDMGDLTGLWRVLSFLGLGLALIGLGAAYRRFVLPAKSDGVA